MKISKELAKGSTGLLVLSVIEQGDMYGYQIIKEIERRSEKVLSLNEGTLYPILHALEKEECLEAYWEDTESLRRRRFYRITEAGRKKLADCRGEWGAFSAAVGKVIGER